MMHEMPSPESPLSSIQRLDVFREVLNRIDLYIESNRLRPGDRLPGDRDLATALGVSRPLVRQALKVLEGLGRLEARQGSGTYVSEDGHRVAVRELTRGLPLDADFFDKLLPVRVAVELQVMCAAFEHRDERSIDIVRSALAQRGAQLEDDPQEAGLDLTFEAALGSICDNEVLRRFQALIHDLWLQAELSVGITPEDRFHLHEDHVGVFAAFERGDLDKAMELFEAHLRELPKNAR